LVFFIYQILEKIKVIEFHNYISNIASYKYYFRLYIKKAITYNFSVYLLNKYSYSTQKSQINYFIPKGLFSWYNRNSFMEILGFFGNDRDRLWDFFEGD
ncbi:hypothetical protein, partial [Calidifontibacillus erzurumensis]|uniref:hypothetical protein n=1 Tax=Calidifontibacillus erzurumensis TaxID=2741433 RepID=UPI001E5D6586